MNANDTFLKNLLAASRGRRILWMGISISVLALGLFFLIRDLQTRHLLEEARSQLDRYQYRAAYETAQRAAGLDAPKAADTLHQADSLMKSELAFTQARQAESARNYPEALRLYKLVIQEDRRNHPTAAKQIAWLNDKLSEVLLKEAKGHHQQQAYETAYKKIQELLFKNPGYQPALKLKAAYGQAADKQMRAREAQQFARLEREIGAVNIEPALARLNAYASEGHPQELADKARAAIQSLQDQGKHFLEEIQALRDQQHYSQAIAMVSASRFIGETERGGLLNQIEGEKASYLQEQERLRTEGEAKARELASDLVIKHLKAPSTANVISTAFYYREYPHYAVEVVVDAENSFGAMLRKSYLACLTLTGGDTYSYSRSYGVQELSDDDDDISRMVVNLAVKLCKDSF